MSTPSPSIGRKKVWHLAVLIPLLVMALLLSWWAGVNRAEWRDAELRKSLAQQACELASTINPELVKKLSFDEGDTDHPAFRVIRERMTVHEQNIVPLYDLATDSLAVFSLVLRDGRIVFGPESVESGKHEETRSGKILNEPLAGLDHLFSGRSPGLVTEFHSDELGRVVSAFAPVADFRTGEILMVVALAIDADQWRGLLQTKKMLPFLSLLAAMALLGLMVFFFYRRFRKLDHDRLLNLRAWIFVPTALMALTLFAFYGIHEYRSALNHSHKVVFTETLQARNALNQIIAEEVNYLRSHIDYMEELQMLRDAWVNDDFTVLDSIIQEAFSILSTNFGISHLNIIGADRTLIARGRIPWLTGDTIDRHTVLDAEQTGADSWGIEVNRRGNLSVRYIRPWIIGSRTIGYIEMGVDIDHLTERIKRLLDIDTIIAGIRKEHILRERYETWRHSEQLPATWDDYPNHLIHSGTGDQTLPDLIDWFKAGHHPTKGIHVFQVKQNNVPSVFGVFHLIDAGGRTVADIILLRDNTAIIKEQWGSMAFKTAIGFLFLCGGLFILWVVAARTEGQLTHAFTKLRDSEERWKFALEGSGDGVWDWNAQTDRVHYSGQWKAMLGFEEHEIGNSVGEWQKRVYRADRRPTYEAMNRHFNGETAIYMSEHRVQCKNGSYKWILDRGKVVSWTAEGKPLRMIGTHTDITERRNMEEALRESSEHYRLLFETVNDAIIILKDGRIVDCNSRTLLLFGLSNKEMILGRHLWELSPSRQPDGMDSQKRVLENINAAEEGTTQIFDWKFYSHEKALADASVHLTGFEQKGERFLLAMIRDVTQERALADRLQRAEKMESLGIMAGGVAHDLNNVLGVLMGYSELILTKVKEGDTLHRYSANIRSAAERSAMIVQDMLALARRGVQTTEVISIADIINELVQSPEIRQHLSSCPNIELSLDMADNLPLVEGSSSHLRKALINLAINATEAMPDVGILGIQVKSRYLDRPLKGYDDIAAGRYVVISVSDTGTGISEEDRQRIFEPFYTKKMMGRSGTGLGLSVVWGVVKDHRGYIDVESHEGRGSIFTLYIPATEKAEHQTESTAASDQEGRGELILVVDDMEEQRTLARQILEHLGYRVETAASGEEALDFLQTAPADLVVLDMIMEPGMDGLDTYRKIAALHPGQRAVIVSGFAETDRVRTAQSLGAGGYLKKPYTLEALGKAVRNELDRQ